MQKINISSKILTLMIAAAGLNSCVTGQTLKKGQSKESHNTLTTTPAKVIPVKPTTKPVEETLVEDASINLNTVDFQATVERLKSANPAYTEKDMLIADALVGKVQPQSLYEATLALSVLHEALNAAKDQPTFKETDLYNNTSPTNQDQKLSKIPSLEKIAEKRKIDFISVLNSNPHLQNYQTSIYVIKALDLAYNSKQFRSDLTQIIEKRVELWTSLGKKLGMSETSVAETNNAVTPPERQAPLDYNPNEIANEDEIFNLANQKANAGKFRESIALLQKISNESPQYGASQEKIKEYSNSAVRQLRKLAAQAFQSSTPVSDLTAKAEYLKSARRYLETALDEYPEADQLSTVRENLSVINRDLLRVSEQLERTN